LNADTSACKEDNREKLAEFERNHDGEVDLVLEIGGSYLKSGEIITKESKENKCEYVLRWKGRLYKQKWSYEQSIFNIF
jgi:hypothetical protein